MRARHSLAVLFSLAFPLAALAQPAAAVPTPPSAASPWQVNKDWRRGFSISAAPLVPGVVSDGSVPVLDATGNFIGTGRATQATLGATVGVLYDLVDLCPAYAGRSCVKFQPLLDVSVGGYLGSGMPYVQWSLGGNVDFYPGGQRRFALTGGFGTGSHHVVMPSLAEQQAAGLPLGYQKNPASANTPILYAQLGGLFNLEEFTANPFAKKLSVGLTVRLQNAVGHDSWWAAQTSFAAFARYRF